MTKYSSEFLFIIFLSRILSVAVRRFSGVRGKATVDSAKVRASRYSVKSDFSDNVFCTFEVVVVLKLLEF